MAEQNIAQVCREEIKAALDSSIDLSTPAHRADHIKKIGTDRLGGKKPQNTHYMREFRKVLKERGLSPQTYGLPQKGQKFVGGGGPTGLKANVTPRPQPNPSVTGRVTGGEQQPQQAQPGSYTQPGQIDQKTPLDNQRIKDAVQEKERSTFLQTNEQIYFTQDGVGITMKAVMHGMSKLFYGSYFDGLEITDEEKRTLGEMWLPFFREFLSKNWGIVATPIVATFGVMAPKWKTARDRKQKESKPKNHQKTNNEGSTPENSNAETPADKTKDKKQEQKEMVTDEQLNW